MKFLRLLFFLCSAAALGTASFAKPVTIHQVPIAVKKTIDEQVLGAKLGGIERDDEEAEVTYTVQMTSDAGQEREFTVAEDGTLLTIDVSLDQTPPEVQKSIKAQVGQGKLESIEKTFENGQASFDIEMTKKDGSDCSFSVGPDGKLTSLQVSWDEVPLVVRKTIEAHAGDGKPGAVYRLIEGAEVSYDAEVDHAGKVRDVVVSAGGKLESLQVAISEVTPEAQKTITEKIGTGRILRIDKSFELKQGVQPYEVEARTGGKTFTFSVGPKGRLLKD